MSSSERSPGDRTGSAPTRLAEEGALGPRESSDRPDGGTHDAAVARLLGLFFLVVTLPVLAGTFFASLAIDRILNLSAAFVLGGVGALFLAWSRRLGARAKAGPPSS